jgi:hypothetical protein
MILAILLLSDAGCKPSPSSVGALLVNSINTSLLCGAPNLRPVKILFHPSTDHDILAGCGDQVQLGRRMDRGSGVEFVRRGEGY